MTINKIRKQQEQQRLTYYKKYKYEDNRNKASITHYSPPDALLLVTFLFVMICNSPTPATFESRGT